MPAPLAIAPRTLRAYQVEARDAVLAAWGSDEFRRVGIVLPTGSGKSTVIASIADAAYRLGLRVVMLAHRGELLDQMTDAVRAVNPDIPVDDIGIVRAARDDHHAPIVAATLQTLASARRLKSLGKRDVVLWDEVHHIGAEGWHNVMVELGGYSDAYFCGFTATMRREDKVSLGDSIEKVVYEKDLRWAIDEGYLTAPRGLTVKLPDLDLHQVKSVAGDFAQGQLGEVMEAVEESIVDAILRHAYARRAIVFAASVDAAHSLASALSLRSIPSAAVTGQMSVEQRDGIYQLYRDGSIQMLVTVQVLTEGADFPMCDAVVLARPTKSQVLYSQMVGRALRLYPGKTDALVLDLVGTTRVLSLVTITDLDPKAETFTVDPDGTILEEEEEDREEPVPTEKIRRMGPIDVVDIDLLSSDSMHKNVLWFQTDGGKPFISYSDHIVFLWPGAEEGSFRAGYMSAKGPKTGDWIQPDWTDIDVAACAAEDFAADTFGKLPLRNDSWRRSQPPSDAQLRFARMLGIPDADDMTKARLSDTISIKLATARLDQ